MVNRQIGPGTNGGFRIEVGDARRVRAVGGPKFVPNVLVKAWKYNLFGKAVNPLDKNCSKRYPD